MYKFSFVKIKRYTKYETRNKDKLHVKSVNTNLKSTSINVIGVKLWNNLDKEIRNSASIDIFKRRLKFNVLQSY